MTRSQLLSTLLLLMGFVLLTGCGGGGGGNPSTPSVAGQETVLAEASGTLGAAGGMVQTSNGVKLVVPAGAFTADQAITLRSVGTPTQSNAPESFAVEVTGAGSATLPLTITLPAPAGYTQDEISGSLLDLDSGASLAADVILDSTAKTLSATLTPTRRGKRGLFDRIRLLFEVERFYLSAKEETLIRMPYYEQVGGSCWVMDARIIMRAMSTEPYLPSLGDMLRSLELPDTDWGGNIIHFTNSLPPYLKAHTGGTGVMWRGYVNKRHMHWRILRELDAGHPLILRHPFIGQGHAVLIVGYKDDGATLIVHDTKDVYPTFGDEGGMYSQRTWAWLTGLLDPQTALQIEWITTVPPALTLQTLGLPSNNEARGQVVGRVSFENPSAPGKETTRGALQFRPSADKGYVWLDYTRTAVDMIDSDVQNLVCQLPVWNAAATAADLTVRVQVNDGNDISTILAERECKCTLAGVTAESDAGKAPTMVTLTIPLTEVRDKKLAKDGMQPITIIGNLYNASGKKIDSWMVDAVLNMGLVITRITPSSQDVSKKVVIYGNGFGTVPAVLTVAGRKAGISSIVRWTDTEIEYTVDYSAPSDCPVTVTVNGLTSNIKHLTATVAPYMVGSFELRALYIKDPATASTWLSLGQMGSMAMTVNSGGSTTINAWGGGALFGSGTITPNNTRPNWSEPLYNYSGFSCNIPIAWPNQGNTYGHFLCTYNRGVLAGTVQRPDGTSFAATTNATVIAR